MSTHSVWFVFFFIFILGAFCVFLCFFRLSDGRLQAELDEVEINLTTSQGRERKQEAEYKQVSELLPLKKAELEEMLPLAQSMSDKVTELKQIRKELREERKRLKEELSSAAESEDNKHEP